MKNMQAITQAWRAFSPSAFGELVVMALKMLTRTRNKVTSRAILPWKFNFETIFIIYYVFIATNLNVIWRNEEGGPADHDEQWAGEVVRDHVVSHLPIQNHLKACNAVIPGLSR